MIMLAPLRGQGQKAVEVTLDERDDGFRKKPCGIVRHSDIVGEAGAG
jgi:hypothetical protein